MSTNPIKCPMCHKGNISFHDTNRNNETDMGNGKPHMVCDDQEGCGLVAGVWTVGKLRELFRRVKG